MAFGGRSPLTVAGAVGESAAVAYTSPRSLFTRPRVVWPGTIPPCLRRNAEAGKTYTIEYFDALGGTPNVLATGLAGPDHLDPVAGDTERFYRLLEE